MKEVHIKNVELKDRDGWAVILRLVDRGRYFIYYLGELAELAGVVNYTSEFVAIVSESGFRLADGRRCKWVSRPGRTIYEVQRCSMTH